MKMKKLCVWCGAALPRGESKTCYHCQEVWQEELRKRLETVGVMPVSVKDAATKINRSKGHVRRILEYPGRYPWANYGITDAHRLGKEWQVYFLPVEYQKERAKLLLSIADGAHNILGLKSVLGFNPILTPRDFLSLLKSQELLSRRKTSAQREEQKRRIQQNLDSYAGQLYTSLAEIANDWLQNEPNSTASDGQQPRTAGAGL